MTDLDTPENLKATELMMQSMARGLDEILNIDLTNRQNGFVLLVFPFNGPPNGRTNYISNAAERKEIVDVMKEVVGRFEEKLLTDSSDEKGAE